MARIILARSGHELPFSPQAVIVLFALISIYIWFIFGHELRRVLKSNKLLKVLIISLIGSAPIMLVFIYENLLEEIYAVTTTENVKRKLILSQKKIKKELKELKQRELVHITNLRNEISRLKNENSLLIKYGKKHQTNNEIVTIFKNNKKMAKTYFI